MDAVKSGEEPGGHCDLVRNIEKKNKKNPIDNLKLDRKDAIEKYFS